MKIQYLSVQEKLDLVTEYLTVQHGGKGAWLAEHGVRYSQMKVLKDQYFGGDLDRGLVPRTMDDMSDVASARQLQLEKQVKQQAQQLAALQAELEKARQVNDVLGKAIELVERFSEPEQHTPTTVASSTKKTSSS